MTDSKQIPSKYGYGYSISEYFKMKKKSILIVQNDGLELKSASEELKNDREVVSTTLKQHEWSFIHASKRLQNDKSS